MSHGQKDNSHGRILCEQARRCRKQELEQEQKLRVQVKEVTFAQAVEGVRGEREKARGKRLKVEKGSMGVYERRGEERRGRAERWQNKMILKRCGQHSILVVGECHNRIRDFH